MMTSSLIVPTYSRAENVTELVRRLRTVAPNADIFVMDDSPSDDTARVVYQQGRKLYRCNGDRGWLAGIAKINATSSDKVIIMNANLQYPPELVPDMLKELDKYDMVVASRYCRGGRVEGRTLKRKLVAFLANLVALPLAPGIKDRMSGYFGFRRSILTHTTELSGGRFGTMLEVLIKGQPEHVVEIPFTFITDRKSGQSRLSATQVKDYLVQLWQLYLTKYRWIKFGIVGGSGAVLKLVLMYLLTDILGIYYIISYLMSFSVVVAHNYVWNSRWTFKQSGMPLGLAKYAAVSAFTVTINTGVIYLLTDALGLWYMFSTAIAILIAFSINYFLSRRWVWLQQSQHTQNKA